MALAQILVVDDSIQWRTTVLKLFDAKNCYEIIGVAENGWEAVQKVGELRPDLILMDINLPEINGIEATQRICKNDASSKIVFVSMMQDPAIVQAAFDVGGSGYILKQDFAQDFCSGIRAVLDGRQFLSRSLNPGSPGSRQ
jgi:two-component system, NarL family, response regulator DegU